MSPFPPAFYRHRRASWREWCSWWADFGFCAACRVEGVSLFTALLRPRKSFTSVTSVMTPSLRLEGTFSLWDLASIVLRREMTYFVALFKIFPLNTKLKISIKGLFDIFLIIAHCAFDKLFTHFNNCDFLWKWHKNNYFFEIPLCICFWNYVAIKNSLSN